MNIMSSFRKCQLNDDEIALLWLCQAGFVIKNANNYCIAIDPYLSHCGERMKGFVRMSPIIVKAEELLVDAYIVTHKHFDHFDYDSIPLVAKNKNTRFYGPSSCVEEFIQLGLSKERINLLEVDDNINLSEDVTLKVIYADHGKLEPCAVGLILQIESFKIYITGDTAFVPKKLENVKEIQPEIMIASINGEFGNLNNEEGAKLAKMICAKAVIPCHFWTFLEHKGRPCELQEEFIKVGCNSNICFLTPGEVYICKYRENGLMEIKRRN